MQTFPNTAYNGNGTNQPVIMSFHFESLFNTIVFRQPVLWIQSKIKLNVGVGVLRSG